ncbi:Serine Protease 41 [Manis pentadactyla]|nr:Serine Protease 41 [Manis pentadactyla]
MVDQGYGEAWVTSVVKVKCEILEPGLQLALVVSRHNSITERVRSGSDVTGSARWWIRVMMKVKCQILASVLMLALVVRERKMVDQGYGEAWVTSVVKVKCEILEPGLQLALVVSRHNSITERVRSGSDVTGSARWWIRVMMKVKCQILASVLMLALVVRGISITERVRFWSDVTGAQDGGSGLWRGMGDVSGQDEGEVSDPGVSANVSISCKRH